MRSLLYKEFKLAVNPFSYLVPLLGLLLLIPDYPYFIALMYVFFITIPTTFSVGKDQRDIQFSVLLPVRKRDIVKARYISIIVIEMIHIVLAVIFGIINTKLYPQGNSWLMDINTAFFGIAFMMFGVFNTIFLAMFYRTAYKVAMPVFVAMTVTVIFIVCIEFLIQSIPVLKMYLDGIGNMVGQLPVLAAGILMFAVSNVISYKQSAKSFEKLDI